MDGPLGTAAWAAIGAAVPVIGKFALDLFNIKRQVQKEERKDAWDEAQKLRQELTEQLQNLKCEIADLRNNNLNLAVENANLKALVSEMRKENAFLTVRVLDLQAKLGGLQPLGKGALIVTDDIGIIQVWSGRMTEIFGWTEQEAIGKSLIELLMPEDNKLRKSNYFDKLRDMNVESFLFEPSIVPGKTKTGSSVEIKLTPMGWKAAGRWTFAAVIRKMDDVTGRAMLG